MMKLLIPAVLLIGGLSACARADEELQAQGTAVVDGKNADRVHLRDEASQSSRSLGLLFTGTQVTYYSDPSAEWVTVGLPGAQYGIMGYMKSEYLCTGDPSKIPPRFRQEKITGIAPDSWVNLREDISMRVKSLKKCRLNEQVTVMGELSVDIGWSLVTTDGLVGYIATQYLTSRQTKYIKGSTADRVHLRAGAGADTNSKGLYFTGTPAMLLGHNNNGWENVTIGVETGYVKDTLLSATPVTPLQPKGKVTNISTGSTVNLRTSPSMSAAISKRVLKDTIVTVLGETHDGWYYVQALGLLGYIRSEYLAIMQ